MPVARSVVWIPAGTSRMPPVRFTVSTAFGSSVWNAVLIGAGYLLGVHLDRVSGLAGAYSDVVLVAVIGGAILYPLIRHLRRRKRED